MNYTNEELKTLSERLSLIATIGRQLLLPGIVVVGLIYFFILVFTSEYRVTVSKTPKAMNEAGLTETAILHLVAAKLTEIQDRSNTVIHNRFQVDKPLIDFKIPKTALSFQSMVDWTKGVFGQNDTVVNVDVTLQNDMPTVQVVLTDPAGHKHFLASAKNPCMDIAIGVAASEVFRALDPLVSGAYKLDIQEDKCKKDDRCKAEDFVDALGDLEIASQSGNKLMAQRAFISMAHIYAISNDYDVAFQYLTNAEKVAPTPIAALETRLMRGVEYSASNQHGLAINEYREIVQRVDSVWSDPSERDYLLAFAHQDWARDLVAQANQLKPEKQSDKTEQEKIGRERSELLKQAIQHYAVSVELNPLNTEAMSELARQLYWSGRQMEAASVFQQVLLSDPANAMVHKDLGNTYRDLGLKQYRDSHNEAFPNDCRLLEPGFSEIRTAVRLASVSRNKRDVAQAYLDLAKTYEACGDFVAALDAIQLSLSHEPGYELAVDERIYILCFVRNPPELQKVDVGLADRPVDEGKDSTCPHVVTSSHRGYIKKGAITYAKASPRTEAALRF